MCLPRDRLPDEACCLADPGRPFVVYFPDGGAVKLDASGTREPLQVRWLDISRSTWHQP